MENELSLHRHDNCCYTVATIRIVFALSRQLNFVISDKMSIKVSIKIFFVYFTLLYWTEIKVKCLDLM